MDQKQEFLILLRDYDALRETLKQKAWEITPADVKELLCGEEGLLADNAKQALEWLIEPKWQLNDRPPIKAIIDGDVEKVKQLLHRLIHEVYF